MFNIGPNFKMNIFLPSFVTVFAVFFGSVSSAAIGQSSNDLDTLELVQILYRHGDRAPIYVIPTDKHDDYWKKIGYGQLTNIGKAQQYELGQFIRQYFGDFLNESYCNDQVVIRSTDYDRTLMSAEANLAGLYPPKGEQVWNPNVNWQPIPVHTVPVATDYLLSMGDCPKYDQALQEVLNSTDVRNINEKHKDLYEYLTNMTGLEIKDLNVAGLLHDTLFCEHQHNLSMPYWLNDTIYDTMGELQRLTFIYFFLNAEQQRLRGGPLVKEMIQNANDKVAGKIDDRRAFIYSAHDDTITAFLSTLGVYDQRLVHYANAVFLELHRPPVSGEPHWIRIMYRNTTAVEPVELIVPHCAGTCGMKCPLPRLAQIVKNLVPDDIAVECALTDRTV